MKITKKSKMKIQKKYFQIFSLRLNKKAVFFSIVSILVIILFMTMTRLASDISVQNTELEITKTRIKVLNSLIKDMEENYFEKMIYVSGKNSLVGLSKYYSYDLGRIEKSLFKAMEDTIDDGILLDRFGNEINLTKLKYSSTETYMNPKYTSNELIKNISALFEDMGIEVRKLEINLSTGNITQKEPWHVILEADVIYDLRDKTGIVSWRGTSVKKVNISVIGVNAYDYENHVISNTDKITSEWNIDKGNHYTEPSLITKLSDYRRQLNSQGITSSKEHGKGLCSPDFSAGEHNCTDDVHGDYS